MKQTGGRWNKTKRNLYFIASSLDTLLEGVKCHSQILIAVNELREEDMLELLAVTEPERGVNLFIDSGVFNLANSHAKAHGMRMDEALSLAPQDLDSFQPLYDKYVALMQTIGEAVWGYIEIDQGGRENKIKTRAKLEALGLRPIPVYHPFNDGWDYFDQLAKQYDRICMGNVVQADPETRKRLLATAWERKRKANPDLWIHLLGLTPNERLNAYPVDSCDSSSWLRLVRWADSLETHCAGKSFSPLQGNITYDLKADPHAETGHRKARRLGAYDAAMIQRNWRASIADYQSRLYVDPRTAL